MWTKHIWDALTKPLRLPPATPGADASVVRRTFARLGSPANVSIVFTLPSRMYMTLWQAREGGNRLTGWNSGRPTYRSSDCVPT